MAVDAKDSADEFDRAVKLSCETFAARSIRYALVGGLAASLRGRPRFTKDVDFVVDVPQLILPSLTTWSPAVVASMLPPQFGSM